MFKKNYVTVLLLIIPAFLSPVVASQVNVRGWFINTDTLGIITSMLLSNPKTALKVEASVEIFVDSQKNPARGRVKFTNGFERDLNQPKEIMQFWIDFGGQVAMWEYFANSGKVNSIHPDTCRIPAAWYSHTTRIIPKSGKEYIGRLEMVPNSADWFTLQIDESTVFVYQKAVAEMQQLK
jgi:hypothetical protein